MASSLRLITFILLHCVLLLSITSCQGQEDCTGVECPLLENCIEEVLERDACCSSCIQTGCTCEGYQYYDCLNAGFRNGKVPESKSYFVDFGSTECSCPKGGGRISCHFIPCPEIPQNCIDLSEPADGCTQCERIGCVNEDQKYEAGHTFQMDPCKVCHCPNAGGELMCYPVPDCDPDEKTAFPATADENVPEKHYNDPYTYDQDASELLPKESHMNRDRLLPLFKTGNLSTAENEDYYFTHTDTGTTTEYDLAAPTSSAVIPVTFPEPPAPYANQGVHEAQELRETTATQEEEEEEEEEEEDEVEYKEGTTESPLIHETTQGAQKARKSEETVPETQYEQEERLPLAEEADAEEHDETVVALDKDITETGSDEKEVSYFIDQEPERMHNVVTEQISNHTGEKDFSDSDTKHEPVVFPAVKFSPTSQPPVIVKANDRQISNKQSQTLSHYEREEEGGMNAVDPLPASHEVSVKEVVEACCAAGQQWASVNGQCIDMPQSEINTSVCRIAQKQCCIGYLKESSCLAGMTAAKEGEDCEANESDTCGKDSYKECCSCCSLGLKLRSEGHSCEAHQFLGYPCSHVFLTCCEGDEGFVQPTLKQRTEPEPTSLPERVSDTEYPKEAFSVVGEEEKENTVDEEDGKEKKENTVDEEDGKEKKENTVDEEDGKEKKENTVDEEDDIDECLVYAGQLCHQSCINTWGSYKCACFPGHILLADGYTCRPENEDHEDNNRLIEEEETPATEATPMEAPTTAIPIEEEDLCKDNGGCMHHCSQVGREVTCSCFPGYARMGDGFSCEDVNECSSGTHNCFRGELCVNSNGSFQCVRIRELCDEGFIHDMNKQCIDVNECLTDSHNCQARERCINTIGSFTCEKEIVCPPGYQLKDDNCEDIDECAGGSHNCNAGLECQNTAGSFYCNPKQGCLTGFVQDLNGNCIDVNECTSLIEPCSTGFNCINTVGSYTCQRKIVMCSRGYHASPDGTRCIDVDECQAGVHRCGEGQICHNLPGTYRCDCKTGYQYDMFSRTCVDINECWRYPGRLCAQTCENNPGSYRCSCTSGFALAFDGKNCEDVNECDNNPCSQECANIYGSYQCYCRQGFYLKEDGRSCEDIDECSQSIGNLCAFQCVNVPGSYQCACPEHGYTMSPNGRTCRDIDECAVGAHNCSTAETCYNIQGGFRCLSFSCPQNYKRVSDMRCERVSCLNYVECQSSPLRITYYQLSFQTNIVVPAQIFRIGPSPAYAGDSIVISITSGNAENFFSTRKLNPYTGAVYLQRQVRQPKDFLIDVEMKLWRQGTFTTFLAKIYVFITAHAP
ncbi:fibulin-2 isoform X1 [Acipenser ruthenus]|uniref:fibulin-2 isoform X1 n=1 Tax=Acipenser ruthenus TaxID=7906 RepID=UPI0027426DD8|nr:fibulin-2 isoform X1 [Acipenser ruthenus]XP_058855985.1 fibulin-2 isoform X1 [Acipenser ruthenus]